MRKAVAQAREKAQGAARRQRGGCSAPGGRGGNTALTCWSFLPPRPASLLSRPPSLSTSAPGAVPVVSSVHAAAAGCEPAGGPRAGRRGGQGAGKTTRPPPPSRTQQMAGLATRGRARHGDQGSRCGGGAGDAGDPAPGFRPRPGTVWPRPTRSSARLQFELRGLWSSTAQPRVERLR